MKAEKRTENLAGSSLPLTIKELPVHEKGSDKQIAADVTAPGLSSGAFTTFFTWRGNGVVPKLISIIRVSMPTQEFLFLQ